MRFKFINILLLFFSIAPALNAEQSDKFKVGVITAMTGPLAEYGEAMENGITLAKERNPDLFTNIQFEFEDASYNAHKAVLAFKKLHLTDKVNAIYSFGVHLSKSVAPLANSYKLPLIAQSVDPSISINSNYVVRFFNHAGQYARLLTGYIKENNYKKIGIVYVQDSYTVEVLNHFKKYKPDSATIIMEDDFQPGQTDFRSTITKLKHLDVDIIGVLLSTGQAGPFHKQLHEQELNVQTFGTNFFESSSEIEASQGAMNGTVFPNNIVSNKFRKNYRKRFGIESQLTFAALAHEFALTIGERFNSQPQLRGAKVIEALEQSPIRKGSAVGDIRFLNTKDGGRFFESTLVMKTIKDGKVATL